METTPVRKLDSLLATANIAKLVDSIISHNNSDATKIKQIEEFKLLKEKYISADTVCSLAASHGILSLIENGVLGISACSEFISMLPSMKNFSAALETLSGLLIIDLKVQLSNQSVYTCPFSLVSPQHPLISVLKLGRDSWLHVLNQMNYICYHHDEVVRKYSLDLLKPVFLYILCSPKLYNYSKRQTWSLLLNICSQNAWKKGMEIILCCISWQQTDNDIVGLLEFSCMLCELADATLQSEQLALAATVAPYLASLSLQLLEKGMDPRMCISTLRKVIPRTQDTASEVAILLAEAIGKCPSLYLSDYILLCSDIVKTRSCNALSAKMILVSLLQWLAFPNILVRSSSKYASELANLLESISNEEWKLTKNARANALTATALTLRAADAQKVDFAYIITEAGNTWKANPEILKEWLSSLKELAPQYVLTKLRLVLSAICLEGGFGVSEAEQESCELLLRLVESNAELGMGVLTILLYKLAREKSPESQLKLLHCIPAMATQKENVPLVLSTLESLKIKRSLKPIVLNLYVRLWKVEPRCFSYLHKVIVDDPPDLDWDWELAKATALKEICGLRPHVHGKDLLPLLSQTLNRCSSVISKGKESAVEESNERASAASALALAGTAILLKEKIIDPCAVWNVLGPKLSRDKRPSVIQSLCELLTVILNLKSPSPEYETLSIQLVAKLWSYVVMKNDLVVKRAALESLASVSLSQMPLKYVPENYRQNITLPSAYAKTPVDAARKPEDVLPYTPGVCWIQLLNNIQHDAVDDAGKMLESQIKKELISQRGVFRTPAGLPVGREPDSYKYLPEHSVIRALYGYLKSTSNKILESEEDNALMDEVRIALTCLNTLGQAYPKPFPGVDWSFLNVYSERGQEYRYSCLRLAIRQAQSSLSARKFVEEKFNSLTPPNCSPEMMEFLFEYLGDICKGIPPNSWRPLIEGCLLNSLEKLKAKDGSDDGMDVFVMKLLSFCKSALLREDIPDVNRSTIALIMETLLENLDVEDSVFTSFVECVGELPTKYIERMSSPSVWWEVTSDKLRKGARIRCELAGRSDSENPLFWLNEIIDAASSLPGEYAFILKTITPTLLKYKEQNINCQWILQLMGQIVKMINDSITTNDFQAPAFLIDVWILCIICMSGCYCLTPDIKKAASSRDQIIKLFPQAVSTILKLPEWQSVSPQVLEWQLHASTSSCVPEQLQAVLHRGILSVHQNSHLLKKNAWMRFVASNIKRKKPDE